jgi:hypothetical protein
MNFIPQIWQAPGGDPFLACANRTIHGPEVRTATGFADPAAPRHREFISHPIAVAIDPPGILFGILDKSRTRVWQVTAPDSRTRRFPAPFDALTAQCAELALREAWRCAGNLAINPAGMAGKLNLDGAKATAFRDGAILRNVFIWMRLGAWERDGLTVEQKLEVISAHGFKCTRKAFARLLENEGLSL